MRATYTIISKRCISDFNRNAEYKENETVRWEKYASVAL